LASAPDPAVLGESALFTLAETIERLSSARSVEDVAAVVRSTARRISGADGVTFVLRDGDQCWYLDEDAVSPLWKGKRFPLTSCISGWAMLNRMTAVVPDIYADNRIPHGAYRPTFVRSLVMTPVRMHDPIAAIGAYWSTVREPSPAEIARLEVIARASATALANVGLLKSLDEALARRELVVRELDHRVKNTLAAVQSIARHSMRPGRSSEEFMAAFEARLQSLARGHELLTREGWASADLKELVQRALAAFTGDDTTRAEVDGPPVRLKPETAVSMLMTLHELSNNAAKYGALSTPAGKVAVRWSIETKAAPPALSLVWEESGGPPAVRPAKPGFGLRLIERGLPGALSAQAELDFNPGGLRYALRAPLSERISPA
jgi:two-component sensor histidine kinase